MIDSSSSWVAALTSAALLGLAIQARPVRGDVAADPLPPAARAVAGSAMLTVMVRGVASAQGQITALLYATEEGFPGKEAKAIRRVSVPAVVGSVTLRMTEVPYGNYAIAIYHDINGNQKLDTNWLGIPKEPVAVSNNAKGHMGPPKFKDAKFLIDTATKDLNISLVKL
jgi:uncharacterized protein (DUF2141 family)